MVDPASAVAELVTGPTRPDIMAATRCYTPPRGYDRDPAAVARTDVAGAQTVLRAAVEAS